MTKTMIFKNTIMAAGLALVSAMPVKAIERNPYFGIGAGVSKLSPDVGNSGLTLDKDTGTAVSLTLGLPVTERFNAELGFSQLGTAELSNEDIAYSAFSIGAVAYVLGNEARLNNESGLRAYIRLGLNIIDNDTDILLKEADSTAVWLGAGLEWPLTARFNIRGELASFDGDAQALTVALLFQPGAQPSRAPIRVSTPVVTSSPEVAKQPVIEPTPEPVIQPLPKPEVAPLPEPAAVPMPKSGVLAGVGFETGTAILTSNGKGVLAQLARSMRAYPSVDIEIGAHTDGVKGDANKLALTRGRAIAVARHLVANGVPINRMKARSYGANNPRAAGDTAGARRLNNRIDIIVR